MTSYHWYCASSFFHFFFLHLVLFLHLVIVCIVVLIVFSVRTFCMNGDNNNNTFQIGITLYAKKLKWVDEWHVGKNSL